jgi:predicted amidohydrolase
MTRTATIAAAQYAFDAVASLAEWRAKITRWVEEAVGQGAQILVFPEYAAMELSAIANYGRDIDESFAAVDGLAQEIAGLHQALARKHGVMIVAGSGPCIQAGLRFNVAQVFGPSGQRDSFTKIMPTPWERDPWRINGGRDLKVYDLGYTKVGLLICYDIEFPLLSRALAEAGAEIILVPSNTETPWGYWRVRIGCQARALENQIYTVQSPCVGAAPFCAAVLENTGTAGVFGPPDRGLPKDGVIAMGDMDKPQWVITKLQLDLLAELRQSGSVRTFSHWREQPGSGPLPAATLLNWSVDG